MGKMKNSTTAAVPAQRASVQRSTGASESQVPPSNFLTRRGRHDSLFSATSCAVVKGMVTRPTTTANMRVCAAAAPMSNCWIATR